MFDVLDTLGVHMDTTHKQKVVSLAGEFMNGASTPEDFYKGLTETITKAIGCSRASLWRYSSDLYDQVVCLDLYDAGEGVHHQGATLSEDDFGPYFEAMRRDNMIVASQAREHPATTCFNELYFEPNGIYSLLDVGINVAGKPFGLFCCEQVTFEKEWTTADVDTLRSVGVLCGMALKKAGG
jgi:GAF domain-containing protein